RRGPQGPAVVGVAGAERPRAPRRHPPRQGEGQEPPREVTTTLAADPWPAPTASGPLDAVVEVPGSKSLTNRHLLLAALADSPTELIRPLHSRDSALMIAALRELGAVID